MLLEIKEVFDRYLDITDSNYIDISKLSLDKNVSISTKNVTYFFKEPVSDKELGKYLYERDPYKDSNAVVVPYLRFNYFVSMFNTIKNAFVFDEDYGFKGFLSMRIRHGTFANVLRSVFENNHLISTKANSAVEYNDIEYWKEILTLGESTQLLVQSALKAFSHQVDDNIELALQWINVKSKDSVDNSVFDFDFSEAQFFGIFHNRAGRIVEYERFINETMIILFERLEYCLTTIRHRLKSHLLNRLVSNLDGLQKEINILSLPQGDMSLLNEFIIRCRTDIQVMIKQVERWFYVSKNKYIEEFPITMILETTINYMNSINGNALLNAKINVDNSCVIYFKGKYFESFGDIFINIFSNIIKYNKDLGEKLEINISVSHDNDELKVCVRNNLASSVDVPKLLETLESVNSKVESYRNGTSISYENESGYPKICKSIAVDLDRKQYVISPKFIDNSFQIDISFETNQLIP